MASSRARTKDASAAVDCGIVRSMFADGVDLPFCHDPCDLGVFQCTRLGGAGLGFAEGRTVAAGAALHDYRRRAIGNVFLAVGSRMEKGDMHFCLGRLLV